MGSPIALPPTPPQSQVPTRCPLYLPHCSFLPLFPPPSQVFPKSGARGLGLCKHPRPSNRAALRGEGPEPPSPTVVGGSSAAAPMGGGGQGPALRPARSGHSAHWGGGQEAGRAERGVRAGQVRALAGPGRAPGAGSQVTAPRGAGGGPRFGPVHQPPVGPGAYNGRRGEERTQSAAGLPGLLPPPPAPRASCMRAQ